MDLATALALAAQLVVTSPVKPAPRAVSAMSLASIADKTGSWVRRDAAGLALDFGVEFTPDSDARVLVREGGRTLSFTTAQLEAGAAAALPGGAVALKMDKGVISAGTRLLKLDDLLLAAYQRARTVRFGPVTYALELQGAPGAPEAVVTLRRDGEGMFWIAHHPAAELKSILWLCGIDGTLYGMRLDGALLTFWAEPVPPVRKKPLTVASERLLPTF